MPIRSFQGFLLTLLGVAAAVTLGVRAHDALHPFSDATAAVHGWRVVCAAGVVGVALWAVLAVADAALGRRLALGVGLMAVCVSVPAGRAWETSYWERHGFVHAVRVDGRAGPASHGSTWRGVLGIPCGQPSVFAVTLGPDGRGVGVVENFPTVPSLVLAIALAPLDGPYRYSVHVRLDGDSLWFREPGLEPYAVPAR